MSSLLWKYYREDNVDRFRSLLVNGYQDSQYTSKSYNGGTGYYGCRPRAAIGTSPRSTPKVRKSPSLGGNTNTTRGQVNNLTRGDLNSRDQSGLTILHRVVSSTGENALAFAMALIEHPMVDTYAQDQENGWTALHRALYFGNVTIACALIERDSRDSTGQGAGNTMSRTNALINIKDREGNTAFDVYNATVAHRTLQHYHQPPSFLHKGANSSAGSRSSNGNPHIYDSINGDEVFAFGSNKNLTLGFGDEDDRQHPEKIVLKRPDHLLYRFYREYVFSKAGFDDDSQEESRQLTVGTVAPDLPALIRNRPIIIKDVILSKLHSAILTDDPESNLYMCGFGPGGRLGIGDEITRFNFVCVEGGDLAGKNITAVALGQNHSIAVSDGTIFTWGMNTWGQLGYSLPQPVVKDKDPVNTVPHQILGPLKREVILGVAASAIHSVAYTSTSIYTFGKNEGQLGLVDFDSRSREVQAMPRRVAASQFTAPIQMVSAINQATICLLANHTVYIFANYAITNVNLISTALTTRYETEPGHISTISSGGDTIAAISSRGDLFTVNVNKKSNSNLAALSQPQCIWSLRKGHWDGVKSVGVGENGSLIICTQAGALWRRYRRPKIKDAYALSEFKSKDYKFQRVPGLTNVTAVRSNAFGGYTAIRKDCDVMTQIQVSEPALRSDLCLLFSLRELDVKEPEGEMGCEDPRFWIPGLSKKHFGPLKRVVLVSTDFEKDIIRHVRNTGANDCDVEMSTNLSDASIPVHGFMVAGRCPILRNAFHEFREYGTYNTSDLIISSVGRKLKLQFQGLNLVTVFNFALYIYCDSVVDVWNFTCFVPKSAFHFRQIHAELIKLAARLEISGLESAVRHMSEPEQRLHVDIRIALNDPKFLEDCDTTIQLKGGNVTAHSALLCQRCPFFNSLFKGRSAGQWLASRRHEISGQIEIDMKHIDLSNFRIVLQYLYADSGTELFDSVVCTDIDEFCDIVMNVISIANELMLDRLSQICQQVIGRFVNTRNICYLINALSPCSVTEFKDAGLEYLCLQLEAMLENHLLDDLEEDLLLELDEVVRANQLACLPFVKSGRMELFLHERNPDLTQEIDEERQRKIRDMIFRNNLKENRLSSSFNVHAGSLDDALSSSPSQDRLRRKLKSSRNAPFSPSMRPKDSTADLMFDMDTEDPESLGNSASPVQRPIDWASEALTKVTQTDSNYTWRSSKGKAISPTEDSSTSSLASALKKETRSLPTNKPWSLPVLSSKADMQDIMEQASMNRKSSLSLSLSAEKAKEDTTTKSITPKVSQKERKRQKQQALQQAMSHPQLNISKASSNTKISSPWQLPNAIAKISLNGVTRSESKCSPSIKSRQLSSSSPLDLSHRHATSPDALLTSHPRSSDSNSPVSKASITPNSPRAYSLRRRSQPQPSKSMPVMPHSRTYVSPARNAEPFLQLAMADIIGQQKREQELIKEAAVKRSLHEIQEEQAFQEWWDRESRKAQEEALKNAGGASSQGIGNRSAKAKGNNSCVHSGGRRRRRGRGNSQNEMTPHSKHESVPTEKGGAYRKQ